MVDDNIKIDKYSIEIKQSSKGNWYVGSIRVNSNNKEELKEALEQACNIAIERLDYINDPNKRINITEKTYHCIECNRPIKQKGRCWPCNAGAKRKREAQDRKSDSKIEIELPPDSNELFVLLKGFRRRIAEREGVPPYIIFHDSVLRELALKKPDTKEEMLKIKGIAENNFEKYGEEFLNFLIKH